MRWWSQLSAPAALGAALAMAVGCRPHWNERMEQRVPERARGVHVSYDIARLFNDEPLKQTYKADAVGPIYEPGPNPFEPPRAPLEITREPSSDDEGTDPSAPPLP